MSMARAHQRSGGRERRRWWARPLRWWYTLAFAGGVLSAPFGFAGNQKEEALADSIRVALHNTIMDARPPKPRFSDPSEQQSYNAWLGGMSQRLKRKLPDEQVRIEFLETVWYEARRAGLEPGLVLGLIQVESAYRKYAVSIVGARGYMQVMPFWTRAIGNSNEASLFHMQTNLRFGCVIMRHYLDIEKGDVVMALGRYNGSRGQAPYPNAVLACRKQWLMPGER